MSVAEYLSEHGALSQTLEGFSPRPQQQAMAEQVADAIASSETLVIEAGTGVGKTFAYLVPAMISGKRVIIATGTKNLQDQLFHEDIPRIRAALDAPVTTALLKGRANYLCLHRLQMHREAGDTRFRRQLHELELINDWAGRTLTGDIAEVDDIEEGARVWPLVTSTTENCLGQDCDQYDDCYVIKARREAQAADLVVINHHLFFADMSLKEQGFGDILPGADVIVLDEAHQLPEVATNFFGHSLTSRQLYNLVNDTQQEHIKAGGALSDVPELLGELEKATADLRLALGKTGLRLSWQELEYNKEFQQAFDHLAETLAELVDWLEPAAERSKGLENCFKRSLNLTAMLNLLSTVNEDNEEAVVVELVRWADTTRRGFGLHATPLDVASIFSDHMQAMPGSWIFTSATLAVGDRFEHFNGRMGLESPATACLGSPFDYKNNALLYMPTALPEPSDPAYIRAICSQALPVIEAAGGRTFMLFTSHRALKQAAEIMADHLSYPLLVQGSAPKQRLLKDFRNRGNAVLLGTASFWEGVDVRGSALSCVIIDKLPFASPADPVMQARLASMKQRGMTPFFDYQVPHAVVTLKQGVGRLIRDIHDTGVLMLCDPRLTSKGYGKTFLKSLPEMPLTRDIEDVQYFFNQRESA